MSEKEFEKRKTMRFQRAEIPDISQEDPEDEEEQTQEFDPSAASSPPETGEFEKRKTGTFKRYDPDEDVD